jgi:hypothetical protein
LDRLSCWDMDNLLGIGWVRGAYLTGLTSVLQNWCQLAPESLYRIESE